MQIIAEGIETPDTARLLGSRAIEYGQGYLYGRPAPVSLRPAFARPAAVALA
jgi:EAL domain-containing protein (putative c-di-GMP-specific phosphodiesterase class I)